MTGGIDVRTDVKIVRWPDRYMDPRGEGMWDRVMTLLGRLTTADGTGARERHTTVPSVTHDCVTNDAAEPGRVTNGTPLRALRGIPCCFDHPVPLLSFYIYR